MTKNNNEEELDESASSPELAAYIALCRRMYERMLREGFPWETDVEREDRIRRENSFPWASQADEPTPPEQQQAQHPRAR